MRGLNWGFQYQPIIPRLEANSFVDENGCWIWTGSVGSGGYGSISWSGRVTLVHRVSYRLFIGPIPDGLHIDHVRDRGCRSKLCINPEHLEAVTVRENNRRQRRPAPKTHCPHGHPYDAENTYVYPDGRRGCRSCYRAYQKAAYWAKKDRLLRSRGGPGEDLLGDAVG